MVLWILGLAACLIDTERYERRRDDLTDHDGDGFAEQDDCDDGDATVFEGAVETCDNVDQDCDGAIDEDAIDAPTWYADRDGDGFGDRADPGTVACVAPAGTVSDARDCDDAREAIRPGAVETPYDGVDDDCDGADLVDVDGDGEIGVAGGGGDCDDEDAAVHPGAAEGWLDDGTDNDCDGDEHDPVGWRTEDATTRIDGVSAGGELGRRLDYWSEGACLFANAPYVDSATGVVYAIPAGGGQRQADAAGYATGTGPGVFLSAAVAASGDGRVAVSQVSDRDGAGTVFLLDGAALCAGATGTVDALATLAIEGDESGAYFGSEAVWLDDVDGDGLQELAVTAPAHPGGGTERGAVYVWSSPGVDGVADAAGADLILYGTQDGSGAGVVTTAYDDDGPGVPWLLVGQQIASAGSVGLFVIDARTARTGPLDASARGGIVTWSTGRTVGAVTVGDIDFDGSDNLVAGAWTFGLWDVGDLDGFVDEADAIGFLTYDAEGEYITNVAPVGDFDLDGRADLALLADDAPGGAGSGKLALVPGARAFGGGLDFDTMAFVAEGATGESFGYRAVSAGDFDADGTPDLAVAAPGASHASASEGSIYFLPLP